MARICEICGKKPITGNNVSHAHNKTKRRFLPNLVNATLLSETLDRQVSFKVATSALRTVEHNGGLDNYLLKAKPNVLSVKAKKLKKEILKKQASA